MKVNAIRSAATLTFSVAFVGAVLAQTPAGQRPPQPSTSAAQPRIQPAPGDLRGLDGQTVTLSGCLMREADVAGQTASAAERVGIAPDFILTNAQMRSGSPSGSGTTESAPAAGAPSALKVKLTKIDSDKVSSNLNQQVEVTGRLDTDAGATGATTRPATPATPEMPRSDSPARIASGDLPHLEVTSIKALNQPCAPRQ